MHNRNTDVECSNTNKLKNLNVYNIDIAKWVVLFSIDVFYYGIFIFFIIFKH